MSAPRRACLLLAAMVLTGAAGGCMKSQPMPPGQMDQLWQPSPAQWTQSQSVPIALAQGRRYSRIEIEYEPSPIWGLIGLHELAVSLPRGDTLRVPLSTVHARATVVLLQRLTKDAQAMTAAAATADRDPRRWADETAELLWQFHVLSASVSRDAQARQKLAVDDTAAWVVLPLLEVLAGRRAKPLETPEAWSDELREAEYRLSEVVLLASLRLTGRALSDELVERVIRSQWNSPPKSAVARTREILLQYMQQTPITYEPLAQTAEEASRGAAMMVSGLEKLKRIVRQWPRVNRLAFELRRFEGHPVVVVEFDIRPGQQVVFNNLNMYLPDLVFSGQGRMEVQLNPSEQGKVMRFEAVGGAGVQMRFHALPYAVTWLLGFRLEKATLREVRYRADGGGSGSVLEVMMEDLHDRQEPRRMFRLETNSQPVLADRPGLPPRLVSRVHTRIFGYYNGRRHWYAASTSSSKPELWHQDAAPPPAAETTHP